MISSAQRTKASPEFSDDASAVTSIAVVFSALVPLMWKRCACDSNECSVKVQVGCIDEMCIRASSSNLRLIGSRGGHVHVLWVVELVDHERQIVG